MLSWAAWAWRRVSVRLLPLRSVAFGQSVKCAELRGAICVQLKSMEADIMSVWQKQKLSDTRVDSTLIMTVVTAPCQETSREAERGDGGGST